MKFAAEVIINMNNSKKIICCCFEKNISPGEKLNLLDRYEKRYRSWAICEKEFAPILEKLRRDPLSPDAENGLIYSSSGKYVWKILHRDNDGERFVAYKTNPGKTPWRYIFKSSLTTREMRNYLRFEALGIPIAKVTAAGDLRKGVILQESFIVTEFLENSRDGRMFMPGGELREDRKKRFLFSRLNLELLAKLHHARIFHKAFHPRNLLWRENGKDMEVFWIDVARCREVSPGAMPKAIIVDLHTFFRDMRLSYEETVELLSIYIAAAPDRYLPSDAQGIMEKLLHFRRRRFSKKRYKICE